jgi:hypothetical protein
MPSWIKIRADLESDPRVHRMAAHIAKSAPGYILTYQSKDLFGSVTDTVTRNALRDVTVMGLSRVWFAANDHTTDGVFRHADLSYLDDLAHIPGFGAAMASVGYAIHDAEAHTVTLPRFVEHNAPDKNGERSKTAAARRQQRLRDRRKAAEEQFQEAPSPSVNAANTVNTPRDAVTSRVTPPVTQHHEENNVTPSLSCSSSISDSDSDSDSERSADAPVRIRLSASDPNSTLSRINRQKARIDAVCDEWNQLKLWGYEDESKVLQHLASLEAVTDQQWQLLRWFAQWIDSPANQNQNNPERLTAKKGVFIDGLDGIIKRATTTWKLCKKPRLGPPVVKQAASLSTRANTTPPTPAANENAFLGLLAAQGGKIPSHLATVATNPAAA